jgi:hypothetical protein
MTNQRLAETYLARARELEDYARRVEENPPSIRMSPRWRDTAFLRREAAWWRAQAQALAEAALLTVGPSRAAEWRGSHES